VCVCICVCTQVHLSACMYVCTYAHTHVCMYACIFLLYTACSITSCNTTCLETSLCTCLQCLQFNLIVHINAVAVHILFCLFWSDVQMFVVLFVCMYVYMYACMCVGVCVCVCVYETLNKLRTGHSQCKLLHNNLPSD
jgi:hypothetical protein